MNEDWDSRNTVRMGSCCFCKTVLRFAQKRENACYNIFSAEEFLLCQDVVEQEGLAHMVDSEIYHLYFIMNNGTKIHLRLHENGYVRFQGLLDLCVKIPAEYYDKLITIFAQNSGKLIVNR